MEETRINTPLIRGWIETATLIGSVNSVPLGINTPLIRGWIETSNSALFWITQNGARINTPLIRGWIETPASQAIACRKEIGINTPLIRDWIETSLIW